MFFWCALVSMRGLCSKGAPLKLNIHSLRTWCGSISLLLSSRCFIFVLVGSVCANVYLSSLAEHLFMVALFWLMPDFRWMPQRFQVLFFPQYNKIMIDLQHIFALAFTQIICECICDDCNSVRLFLRLQNGFDAFQLKSDLHLACNMSIKCDARIFSRFHFALTFSYTIFIFIETARTYSISLFTSRPERFRPKTRPCSLQTPNEPDHCVPEIRYSLYIWILLCTVLVLNAT